MAKEFTLTIQGVPEGMEKLRKLGSGIAKAGLQSLIKSAEQIMTESKEVYCPVDTGALRSTGTVQVAQEGGNSPTVALGYGGPAAPYAIYVHEVNRNYHGGKSWKYLETPLKQSTGGIIRNLQTDLEDFISDPSALVLVSVTPGFEGLGGSSYTPPNPSRSRQQSGS